MEISMVSIFKNITARAIAHHINGKKFPVVISSNSAFFYETLKYLDSHVKCVDLIHAFVHPEESGPEKWSLPYVNKLQQRVFIGQKAMDEMAQLYAKENLPSSLTSRFKLIRNYVEIPGNFIHNGITGTARLIYIGRGTPEKRVHLAAKISAKHRENSEAAPILLIGNMHNAIESDDLVHCDLIGVIQEEEEVYRHLLRSDILLLTSSREGFPMAIAEAMACGVIPITTAVGDIPNVIQDGVNGFLLPVVGETEIIDKAIEIIHLLESNPSLTIRIREQARKDAERMFSKDNFVESWNKILTYQ
ncbi:MAG: glycosyltransferase family 4 protein [Flavobacteriales bacterium]